MRDERLLSYYSIMAQASFMLRQGLITQEEYVRLEARFAAKYGLPEGDLYRENHLLSSPSNGNMRHYEGVIKCSETSS